MATSYVTLTNNCGKTIHILPLLPKPKKGEGHVHEPITLHAGQESRPVRWGPVTNAPQWHDVKDCVHVEYVAVAALVRLSTPSKKPIPVKLMVREARKAEPRPKTIRLSSTSPRAVSLTALADRKEINWLKKKKLLHIERIYPIYAPRELSWGYEGDFYICDECGGPIVFRGYPPKPIHV